ncbi:MAG: NAD(P)/FAD-dependent oxidoreductase [Lachnospiraceae bacterium]|nr:NAD(P)/FAD-dependent oxidoreductase [Lachnospiraceae bacterium]
MKKIIVIGAGPAGMMAAIAASEKGVGVTLLESNEKAGKKLFITGKGRCNLTNDCPTDEFFSHVVSNPKFLFSSVYSFDHDEVKKFFEENGCQLKTERAERVFPVSDKSADVISALERKLKKNGVKFIKNCRVSGLLREAVRPDGVYCNDSVGDGNMQGNLQADSDVSGKKDKKKKLQYKYRVKGVLLENGEKLYSDAVIVATGGVSYPVTGSDGNFFRTLTTLGHSIKPLHPALVPLVIKDENCRKMQGLALKNINIELKYGKKLISKGFGELLFTHFGISGPLILTASSEYSRKYGGVSRMLDENNAIKKDHSKKFDKSNDFGHNENVCVSGEMADLYIDLKPAVKAEELEKRIIREFEANGNKLFKNYIAALVPGKMRDVFPDIACIDPEKPVNKLTREERQAIVRNLKGMHFVVSGTRDFNEAIITSGGVNVKEVDPHTMESKLAKGLFFAGEMLDVDAYTGGFNLQIAWSTGHAAGIAAAEPPAELSSENNN